MEQNPQQTGYSNPPKNWLVESILVTIFCCLPFGIAGIVYASQVNSKWQVGVVEGALKSSREAGKWTKIGFGVGLGVILLYIIAMVFFGVAGFWAADRNGDSYSY
jgi:hypothetical protein